MSDEHSLDNRDSHANIADPDVYVRGVPHLTFKRLRDAEPVSWWDEDDGPGFWAVTRYDDIVSASHNWKIFSTIPRHSPRGDDRGGTAGPTNLMEMDPPEHTTYRRIVQPPVSRIRK